MFLFNGLQQIERNIFLPGCQYSVPLNIFVPAAANSVMKKKFAHDISMNTLQVMIVQACGLVMFYLLSTQLPKSEFGEINWTLAVLLTAFAILSFGIEQISIRRIASGIDASQTLSLYLFHVFMTGGLFYLFLLLGKVVFPFFFQEHHLLLLLGVGKLMIFLATPFKQVANGLERFRSLLWMSVCSNLIRSVALMALAFYGKIDLFAVVLIFIAGDAAEFMLSLLIMRFMIKVPVRMSFAKETYAGLVKEALPQLGVTIFSSVLARFDWILLGLLAGNVILANYSFAYKVVEVATMPLLIIAPVLIPRFTKLFLSPGAENKSSDLAVLLRVEMIIASLFSLLLNMLWIPVIDPFTAGKYGSVNQHTILLLSAAMPFLYFNNFLWTINFAKGKLKMIFYVFLISFLVNVAGDVLLIPFFKAEGAAVAYLSAIVVQLLLYLRQTELAVLRLEMIPVFICPVLAAASGLFSIAFIGDTWSAASVAVISYFLLLLLFRQLRKADLAVIKRITGF